MTPTTTIQLIQTSYAPGPFDIGGHDQESFEEVERESEDFFDLLSWHAYAF